MITEGKVSTLNASYVVLGEAFFNQMRKKDLHFLMPKQTVTEFKD